MSEELARLRAELTELKAKLAQQGRSAALLQSFYNSGGVMLGFVELLEADILHLAANKAAASFFNTTPEAIQGKRASALGVPPPDLKEWVKHYRQSEQLGRPVRFEYWHDLPQGPRWLAITVSPVGQNPETGQTQFSYILEDQTERKLAQEQRVTLARSEEARRQMSAILESITDGFFALDKEWRFTYVNHEAERLFGRLAEALLGHTIWEAFPNTADSTFYKKYQQASKQHQVVEFEEFSPFSRRWFRIKVYPSPDGGLSVYILDITARHQAEEAQAALESQLEQQRQEELSRQQALSSVVLAVNSPAELDEVLEVAVNSLCQELAGDSASVFLLEEGSQNARGLAATGFTGQDARDMVLDLATLPHTAAALEQARPLFFTINEVNGEEGRYFEQLGFASTLVIPLLVQGRPIGLGYVNYGRVRPDPVEVELGFARDLANQCALAIYKANLLAENERLLREARAALELRDQFITVAAHELRTPMTILKGWIQLTVRALHRGSAIGLDDLKKGEQNLEKAFFQARRIEWMVENMADASLALSHNLYLAMEPFSLAELLKALLADKYYASAQHSLSLSLGEDDPLLLNGDVHKLEKALGNLLDNAVKFSPAGGPIEVQAHRTEPSQAVISIRDAGPGISPAIRDYIFQPYYQADSDYHGRRFGGLGLGLFVTKAIIEGHGGQIEVADPDSTRPGTTFVVKLPLTKHDGT